MKKQINPTDVAQAKLFKTIHSMLNSRFDELTKPKEKKTFLSMFIQAITSKEKLKEFRNIKRLDKVVNGLYEIECTFKVKIGSQWVDHELIKALTIDGDDTQRNLDNFKKMCFIAGIEFDRPLTDTAGGFERFSVTIKSKKHLKVLRHLTDGNIRLEKWKYGKRKVDNVCEPDT